MAKVNYNIDLPIEMKTKFYDNIAEDYDEEVDYEDDEYEKQYLDNAKKEVMVSFEKHKKEIETKFNLSDIDLELTDESYDYLFYTLTVSRELTSNDIEKMEIALSSVVYVSVDEMFTDRDNDNFDWGRVEIESFDITISKSDYQEEDESFENNKDMSIEDRNIIKEALDIYKNSMSIIEAMSVLRKGNGDIK